MIKYVFLLPLVLSLIWFAYLTFNNHSFEQGRKGYVYIAVVSTIIVIFFSIVWLVTRG